MSASAAEVGVGREVIWADGWRLTMHVEVRRGPHCKGQILSARDLPTGCQQQCSLVVPTVRATTSHRIERQVTSKQPTKRPEREGRCGQPAQISLPAATADHRLMTRTLPLPPLQAEATAGLATDFGIIHCG
jgi:hypothetical protein